MLLDAGDDKDPWLQLDFVNMSEDELQMRWIIIMAANGEFDENDAGIHLKGISHDLLYSLFQKHGFGDDDDRMIQASKLQAISKEAETTVH